MGLFSKLFGKKVNANTALNTNINNKELNDGIVESIKNKNATNCNLDMAKIKNEYAKTVFLNAYDKPNPVKDKDNYQHYLLYECEIQNAHDFHCLMINEGYLQPAPLKEILRFMVVAELKEILGELGQTTTGKKDALIERILINYSEEIIQKHCVEKKYSISEKGKVFLDEHDEYLKIHHHKTSWDIDVVEYEKHKQPGNSFYDVCWTIFNVRLFNSHHFGRSEYLHMSQLLQETGDSRGALEYALKVLYIDLSGHELQHYIDMKDCGFISKKDVYHFGAHIMLAPGIINIINKNMTEFQPHMIDELYNWKLPVQVCSKGLFAEIICLISNDSFDEESINEKLEKAYVDKINEIFK